MKDTLIKQKTKVERDYIVDYERSVKLCDELQKEKTELQKQKQFSDDKLKALSSEVLALRVVIVQLCKERYGV